MSKSNILIEIVLRGFSDPCIPSGMHLLWIYFIYWCPNCIIIGSFENSSNEVLARDNPVSIGEKSNLSDVCFYT